MLIHPVMQTSEKDEISSSLIIYCKDRRTVSAQSLQSRGGITVQTSNN